MESNSLDASDYLILASITKGITKYTSIFKKCEKTKVGKFREHVNKLEELDLITIDKKDNWFTRNTNPTINLKENGQKFVKDHIEKINQQWKIAHIEKS